jgi:hypothetical protein
MRPERSVSLEFNTRGTIPKQAASLPSSAKFLVPDNSAGKQLLSAEIIEDQFAVLAE